MAGRDLNDSTSAAAPPPRALAALEQPFRGVRIGIPAECFPVGMNAAVREKVEAGIAQLERLGCTRVPVRLPHSDHAIAAYYIIATAEASSNLARYDGVRYGLRVPGATLIEMYQKTRGRGFGDEVKRRIVLGTYVLSSGYYDAYYLKAQKVRTLIARDFANAFTEVDLIVTPTSPVPAFKLGERSDDPLSMYLADIYTVTGSLAGITGISVPCGATPDGLPIGMQIYAPAFSEDRLLQAAHAFEQAHNAAQMN
jgi:aspartyl-tRNA(Asn)/glutamyl-tRNA(Gln) amidotransferase subunit A